MHYLSAFNTMLNSKGQTCGISHKQLAFWQKVQAHAAPKCFLSNKCIGSAQHCEFNFVAFFTFVVELKHFPFKHGKLTQAKEKPDNCTVRIYSINQISVRNASLRIMQRTCFLPCTFINIWFRIWCSVCIYLTYLL